MSYESNNTLDSNSLGYDAVQRRLNSIGRAVSSMNGAEWNGDTVNLRCEESTVRASVPLLLLNEVSLHFNSDQVDDIRLLESIVSAEQPNHHPCRYEDRIGHIAMLGPVVEIEYYRVTDRKSIPQMVERFVSDEEYDHSPITARVGKISDFEQLINKVELVAEEYEASRNNRSQLSA